MSEELESLKEKLKYKQDQNYVDQKLKDLNSAITILTKQLEKKFSHQLQINLFIFGILTALIYLIPKT